MSVATGQDGAGSLKRRAAEAVAAAAPGLVALSHAIHADPELAFEEHRSAERVAGALEGSGFSVRRGIADLETAFEGVSGDGAFHIGVCAEYDALPGIGHACGHNAIAAAAVGAGIGLAAVASSLDMTVRVLGTPAEEGGGGKILMLERGAFDGLHAAMMVHPAPFDSVTFQCLALSHIDVYFEVGAGGHATMPTHGNAVDVLTAAWADLRALRSELPPTEAVDGVILDVGGLPNVVPPQTSMKYFLRAADRDALVALEAVVTEKLRAAADRGGAQLTLIPRSGRYSEFRHDPTLARHYEANARWLGRQFASAEECARIRPSTDMANVSLAVPSIHPLIGIDSLPAHNHSPAFAGCAISPAADKAVIDGAVALAWTAIDAATGDELRRSTPHAADTPATVESGS